MSTSHTFMDSQVKMIQPQGIFNSKNGQQLLEEVDQLTSDIKTILIDFQDVTFMDSSGFSALLVTLKTVRQKNVRLVICSINEQIKMIFDMTNTNQVFEVLPDQ
ncbi:STAS domain-containing protein, partial [Anabaena sp. PCC 7938]